MKRFFFVILFCTFLMSGCSDSSYDEGYSDGYEAARSEMEDEIAWYIQEQYNEGYYDGYDRIKDSRSDAESYACVRSGFSPEEALMVIDAYENGEPFWNNGDPPSEEEYQDAARTLYFFYKYYFDGEFSIYEDP